MKDVSLCEVREASAWVARRAREVRIRTDRIPTYARELAGIAAFRPVLDPRYHYLGHGEATVAFILCLDAVNFGSGWFPWLVKREGLGGYFTIASALTERFEERGPFTAAELTQLEAEECADLFGQKDAPAPVAELMENFARAWRQLGSALLDRFGGSFQTLVERAGRSAEGLLGILGAVPGFDDVAHYGGRRVPFYKRAQLTAVDLFLAFSGDGPGRFDDLRVLTIFADNQVPHVLRTDGVLEYTEALAGRIDSDEEIEPGSRAEVEVRASAIHAVELLVAELEALGAGRPAWQLDQLLWNRGLEPGYDSSPPHRTRTLFY